MEPQHWVCFLACLLVLDLPTSPGSELTQDLFYHNRKFLPGHCRCFSKLRKRVYHIMSLPFLLKTDQVVILVSLSVSYNLPSVEESFKGPFPQLPLPQHRWSIFGRWWVWSTTRDRGLVASGEAGSSPTKWLVEELAGKGMNLFWIILKMEQKGPSLLIVQLQNRTK